MAASLVAEHCSSSELWFLRFRACPCSGGYMHMLRPGWRPSARCRTCGRHVPCIAFVNLMETNGSRGPRDAASLMRGRFMGGLMRREQADVEPEVGFFIALVAACTVLCAKQENLLSSLGWLAMDIAACAALTGALHASPCMCRRLARAGCFKRAAAHVVKRGAAGLVLGALLRGACWLACRCVI